MIGGAARESWRLLPVRDIPTEYPDERPDQRGPPMTRVFLSYGRGDDVEPFDPDTSFLARLHRPPRPPAHFLGRPDRLGPLIDSLRADLDRPVVLSGVAARVGLHGMGGIGKSVLAAAAARDRRVREAFPDGVVWVTVGQ